MAEYIEREALLNKLETLVKRITPIEENRDVFFHDSGVDAAITWAQLEVKKAPTADVAEVVRCGECIHRTDPRRISCKGRRKDWFCADGERRASNEQK